MNFIKVLCNYLLKPIRSGLDIGDIYHVLNGQKIIAETILKLSIENAYKERFAV
jgi:hypothetical protein